MRYEGIGERNKYNFDGVPGTVLFTLNTLTPLVLGTFLGYRDVIAFCKLRN